MFAKRSLIAWSKQTKFVNFDSCTNTNKYHPNRWRVCANKAGCLKFGRIKNSLALSPIFSFIYANFVPGMGKEKKKSRGLKSGKRKRRDSRQKMKVDLAASVEKVPTFHFPPSRQKIGAKKQRKFWQSLSPKRQEMTEIILNTSSLEKIPRRLKVQKTLSEIRPCWTKTIKNTQVPLSLAG